MSKGRVTPEAALQAAPVSQVLRFDIPPPDAPGFLRRQRDAIQYREALRISPSVETMDALIGFLARFVTEPADPEQACELLLDLSRDDYNDLLRAVNREDADFLPSSTPRSSANSAGG